MTLEDMLDKSRVYKPAQKHSENYLSLFHQKPSFTVSVSNESTLIPTTSAAIPNSSNPKNKACFFCRNAVHQR